ncbi:MAG: DUF1287 domain-containing protein [Roseibium sp.]|uniref:DUF1287 domain-containing protein n=1 Tax=Roseibium sp. TaxID=1936156 RepID=UPI00262629A8|nr:DUF1287 domain-containing protein [Roseibium sp.]MCV0428128.1 DUF1287 domain-containing protein [Roseibium sp.]
MKRRNFLIGSGMLAGAGLLLAARLPENPLKTLAQASTSLSEGRGSATQSAGMSPYALKPSPWAEKLISAAESQIGVTVIYDPAYVGLGFPGGDIPRERGVCTDVVIRAYRDAFDLDLQKEVNADMKAHFSSYPKIWGHKRPDRNIDHRRVPNLQTFFRRQGADLPVSDQPDDYLPGDIVSQMLPGSLPHMAIVTHRRSTDGKRLLLVHNIGAGTRLEDRLFDFEITGRYRYRPGTSS